MRFLKIRSIALVTLLIFIFAFTFSYNPVLAASQHPTPPKTPKIDIQKGKAVVEILSPTDNTTVDRGNLLQVKAHFNTSYIKAKTPSTQEKTYYLQPIQAVELLLNGKSYKINQLKKPLQEGDVTFDLSFASLPNDVTNAQLQVKIYTVYVPPKLPHFKGIKKIAAESGIITISLDSIIGSEGGVVVGEGGMSITIPPNALPYDAKITIASASPSEIIAPLGDLELFSAVKVTFEPVNDIAETQQLNAPIQISIPITSGLPNDSEFIVGQQIPVDNTDDSANGITEQLVAVDTATATNGKIITHPKIYPGIFGGGLFAFLKQPLNTGFAKGTVFQGPGFRPGVVVSNNTNTLVSITDGSGRYILPISAGLFRKVTAFDPFRGSSGKSDITIPNPGATITANIALIPLATPPITRNGIRNGGFDRGDLSSWAINGDASVRKNLQCSGTNITPREGQWMADINTGQGSVGEVGSAIKQRFRVPAGVRTLRVDFNFISEEFPEFVNSSYNDAFRAVITTPNGEKTFAQVSVNESNGYTLIGDCSFPGGDSTAGMTGWRTGSVDVSAYAGTTTPIDVDLLFSADDAGDNIYDSHALVDNIRFSTVWVDVKIVNGAAADNARIQEMVRDANEILSQAGINVAVRNSRTLNDPGGLLDLDILSQTQNGKDLLNAEQTKLLGMLRSGTPTDVNVYYVRRFDPEGPCGIALGPDDVLGVDYLTNSGFALVDYSNGCFRAWMVRTFAHELGHLLILGPGNSDLEHKAYEGNFMGSPSNDLGIRNMHLLTRQQSDNMNRIDAPFLAP